MEEQDSPDFEQFEPPPRKRPLLPLAGALLGVIAVAVAALIYFGDRDEEGKPTVSPPPAGQIPSPAFSEIEILPLPPEADGEADGLEPALPPPPLVLPPLAGSDELARRLMAGLSGGDLPPEWLKASGLVRLFVVVVDNIAEGRSPRGHLSFVAVKGEFVPAVKEERLIVDPISYRRYDSLAAAIAAIDGGAAARACRDLAPLFQEAYRELGYPDRSFDETLARAIDRLLDVPAVEGDIELLKGEKAYHFEDPALEGLSPAAKHLLRMGPRNTVRIQGFLRALAAGLA